MVKIVVDYREKGKEVIKKLKELGCEVEIKALKVADFILSENVAVELKTESDFLDSIIDKRLLNQAIFLKNNYQKPLLIVQGCEEIYSMRNIHENAIRGIITSLMLDFKVPILFTKNANETAATLNLIAKREQNENKNGFTIRGERKPIEDKMLQEYIITSLPGVGQKIARNMLKEFKSVINIMNTDVKELQKIEKVGKVKAQKIKDILNKEYKEHKD